MTLSFHGSWSLCDALPIRPRSYQIYNIWGEMNFHNSVAIFSLILEFGMCGRREGWTVRWRVPRLSLEWLTVSATPPEVCCLNLLCLSCLQGSASLPDPGLDFCTPASSCSCPFSPHPTPTSSPFRSNDPQGGFWSLALGSLRFLHQGAPVKPLSSIHLWDRRDLPFPASCQDSRDTEVHRRLLWKLLRLVPG